MVYWFSFPASGLLSSHFSIQDSSSLSERTTFSTISEKSSTVEDITGEVAVPSSQCDNDLRRPKLGPVIVLEVGVYSRIPDTTVAAGYQVVGKMQETTPVIEHV